MGRAPSVSAWWVVASAAAPIAYDLALEPWRIPIFCMFAVLFSCAVFPIWSLAREA